VSIAQPLPTLFRRLWRHISWRRRRQFGLLTMLMLIAAIAEVLSIGAVIPFLTVLMAPEKLFVHDAIRPIIKFMELTDPKQLVWPLTALFGFAALSSGSLRLLLLWSTTRLSFATGADLSFKIYQLTLHQKYSVHCERNSSELISGISTKVNTVIYGCIFPILTLISSSVILLGILFTLLNVDLIVAFACFSGFSLIYSIVIALTHKQILKDGQIIAFESTQIIKALQEGLGGIRDVLINGSQDAFCQIYRKADIPLRRAQGNSLIIAQGPRYAMEALGMVLISALAYSLSQKPDGLESAIPILGSMALGAQRLIPIVQQAYSSWSLVNSAQASLQDSLELLDQSLPIHANKPNAEPIAFNSTIELKQLEFRYSPNSPYVLQNVNLIISKGARIGFIGSTGSGKSTLLDILMGLLEPTAGAMKVDGKPVTLDNNGAWQAHIAHVPQEIFLFDGTIEENIAFGVPKEKIDTNRVKSVAQQAQIATSVESWPLKYQTSVGERGVRLSGGERQRLGIARALYKQADVIIFDEATSALDTETEQAVMHSINNLSNELTLLIIAHRISTLKNCSQIIELGDGGIKRICTYLEMEKTET